MTYARFLAVFLVVPIGVSLFLLRHERPLRTGALWLLLGIVYLATTPWDNVAVLRGLWSFDDARTWGLRLWKLPLEEYLFFGLQTVLTGSWGRHRLLRRADVSARGTSNTAAGDHRRPSAEGR